MDFKKPSGKTATETATYVGGAILGGGASKGVYGLLHEKKAVTEADIKSETNMGYVKRVGIIALAIAGAASVNGKETGSILVKGAFEGMAVVQALELVKDFAATNSKTAALASSTSATGKFAARAMGLGCACDERPQYLARPRRRSLRSPMLELPNPMPMVANAPMNVGGLDALLLSKKMSA